MSRKLHNYLRGYRKKAGFTQGEMAFLLGCKTGAKVSRYENFTRNPSLEKAFAYEAVFGTPLRELFAGIFQKVEEKTKRRAQVFARKLGEAKQDRMTARKLQMVKALASGR